MTHYIIPCETQVSKDVKLSLKLVRYIEKSWSFRAGAGIAVRQVLARKGL